jgi:hypothetical protein
MPCFGAPVTYSSTQGSNSARVTFTMLSQSTLQVTLTNTTGVGPITSAGVLTGVYFTTQNTSMNAQSASATGLLGCNTCNSVNVSGEWAFKANASGLVPGAQAMVLGAATLGLFTTSNNISSTNRSGTQIVGNYDYGIVSSNSNASALGSTPVVRNTVYFTLNTSWGFNPSAIGAIGFLYGDTANYSSSGGGSYGGSYGETPEPATYLMMGIGLLALGIGARKRSKA